MGCAGGAWRGFLENIVNTLAPEKLRKFVEDCQKKPECRHNLARTIDPYRARHPRKNPREPIGDYIISDIQVDKELEKWGWVLTSSLFVPKSTKGY